MPTLRNWDYYRMTETFTDLHEKASQGYKFSHLYDAIISRENILLAFRMIKTNKGSKTPGTDGKTIDDMKELSENDLVNELRTKLRNYHPKKVRREWIEKENGKWRPLGIPCILDRIIQQSFKQVLEPIVESQFFKHSYGFRPLRSAHHAMARIQYLINQAQFHFVVDVDIKSFFDNVNHSLLNGVPPAKRGKRTLSKIRHKKSRLPVRLGKSAFFISYLKNVASLIFSKVT